MTAARNSNTSAEFTSFHRQRLPLRGKGSNQKLDKNKIKKEMSPVGINQSDSHSMMAESAISNLKAKINESIFNKP